MTVWHRLRVESVVRSTPVDKSFILEVPESLKETFRWRAGQHLVLKRGQDLRRCYSISTPPGGALRITVRRIAADRITAGQINGGGVSQDLHDHVDAGTWLDVSAPCGAFILDAEADSKAYRTHYFFAAGSGITPIRSMIGAVLEHEKYSSAHLLYGNRRQDHILFREELEGLLANYKSRFSLTQMLSSPPWLSRFDGWSGRVDAAATRRFVEQHPPVAQDAHYWVCGPGSMNATVRQALMSIDVPAERIHGESFGSPIDPGKPAAEQVRGVSATADVTLAGRRSRVSVEPGETLLEAMLRVGLPAPHTCTAGVCGSCLARLVRGRVHQRSSFALDAADIEEGLVLTCQSVPVSAEVELQVG